ncbi:hypothetical protein [Actinoplanes sp. NBRC 103695]|uniref:hypothetical protein n=1 Tax=Actinoplanes sp. NBRC 103695 TaxID=3032202 RepID=UPI0024A29A31|nr:hypothetical protein [Actinoplanes sp. NBRC 103695]GLZ00665.1 hypothetical protein Acsp02_79170 [Actinoplanes sp. NBRC 103695]
MTSLDTASRDQLAALVNAVETSTGRTRRRASRQLCAVLDGYPATVRACTDPVLVQAVLYYRPQRRSQRWRRFEWVAYAYQVTRELPIGNKTRAAAAVCWATQLSEHGNPAAATSVMRETLRDDLRDSGPYTMFLTGLGAQVRHDRGEYVSALNTLDQLWAHWQAAHHTNHQLGHDLLHTYHAMLTACGHTTTAHTLLSTATALLPAIDLTTTAPTAKPLRDHHIACTNRAPADPAVRR